MYQCRQETTSTLLNSSGQCHENPYGTAVRSKHQGQAFISGSQNPDQKAEENRIVCGMGTNWTRCTPRQFPAIVTLWN
ncbi:hypothetical protein B0H67DRAFT_591058 [Lasiosphaeris hirsuta]|uniref:Uncharacterized protein n=1 Tax=Lasiosphaeris hirsuta TaxID=260670 RepID=A0AA39ZV68_9PEZI|nr:hypothetical protein B0H67DRAFT_591058 [Lasiosphaeris hirsuta]